MPSPHPLTPSPMQTLGVITQVQELRFELLADDGRRRHFTLSPAAPLGWDELTALEHEGCRIAVWHDAQRPGLTTARVHALARLRPPPRTATHPTRTRP